MQGKTGQNRAMPGHGGLYSSTELTYSPLSYIEYKKLPYILYKPCYTISDGTHSMAQTEEILRKNN